MTIAMRNYRKLVEGRVPFKGSNVFAEEEDGVYVVYSYGYHFPMYAYVERTASWFGNEDRYSPSTSRQQSATRPWSVEFLWLDTGMLRDTISQERKLYRERNIRAA